MFKITGILKKLKFAGLILLTAAGFVRGQSFYDMQTIQVIELFFSQPNWDYMMDTAKAGSGSYILADSIRINGTRLDSVGVKYKGNSSYNPNRIKNPLHIELDHFVSGHIYDGITDIKLNNGFKDPTFVRETVAYYIARTYMSAPRANYARLYINGVYTGLYTNVESITKKFVQNHFGSKQNPFFKCNPVYSGGNKSNLTYLGSDSTLYYNSYEIKSNNGWADLVNLCDVLKNNPANLNDILDIDRVIWMHAFNNLLVNLDSYLGAISQNYYFYKHDNGSFNAVVWDLNEAFGCFNNTGLGGPLNITQMQQMSPLLHMNFNERPLIQRLLNTPVYKRMYIAHYKTMLEEFINNDLYFQLAQSYQQLISSSVQADMNKLYSWQDFSNNLTQNITSGPMTIPGLKLLMDGRKSYLSSHTEMNFAAPDILNVTVSDTMPEINDVITITAEATNAVSVYLGYRYNYHDRFVRILMYDDGNHNDGAANDGVYGIQLPVSHAMIQYYVYAENQDAGVFKPQRAEYEFFTLHSISGNIAAGQIVINEFMAMNSTTIADPAGQFEDWVELYNNTGSYVNLTGVYMSDSYNNPHKWQFPSGTVIEPNGYLIVWADNDLNQTGLHSNFKLSGDGEDLVISYGNGYIIDDLSFGPQTSDISFGRYPNGTGGFTFLTPTPLAFNQPLKIEEISSANQFNIFPNPSAQMITITGINESIFRVDCFDLKGSLAFSENVNRIYAATLNVEQLKAGIYIIVINHQYSFKLIKQ